MSAYLATFAGLVAIVPAPRYWIALVSAAAATAVAIAVVEGGRWNVGLLVAPRRALAELMAGTGAAAGVILLTDLLIRLSTDLRRTPGSGFSWREAGVVFLPAAVHEELVFRGYVFQRMRLWSRPAAIGICSAAFAVLHAGNEAVTPLAILNLFVAGVLLSLAYEAWGRLWLPIGIHFGWNLLSGPVLGYGVSGYASTHSLFVSSGAGPGLLTGGAFGIEASLWILPVELAGVILLVLRGKRRHL